MGCAGSKLSACQIFEVIHATEVDAQEPAVTIGKDVEPHHPEISGTDAKLSDANTAPGSGCATPTTEAESTLEAESTFDEPAAEEPSVEDGGQPTTESASSVAKQAMAGASELLACHKVLEAEEVLARALARLEAGELGGDASEAAGDVTSSDVYAAVYRRCRQYDELKKSLGERDERQKLVWEGEGSQLWVYAPAGESWFEYKLVCDIDSPLTHCIAFGTEVDMLPEFEPMVIGEPTLLGETSPSLLVVRALVGFLILRIELVLETCRFYNTERGFLGESVSSEFDHESRQIPPAHWRNKRISVATQFVWIPKGGGERGTVAVQTTRADVGFRIPDWALKFFIGKFAPTMVSSLRQNASRVGAPNGPYASRIASDRLGVYAECAKVEEAAARREAIAATALPGEEWFQRERRLTEPPTSRLARAASGAPGR